MDISVIIINFQSEDLIKSCLNSLKKVFGNEAAIYIVDNSADSSKVDELDSFYKNITVISPRNNIGFARANNLAAQKVTTEYLVFLNPDTILVENIFEPILSLIKTKEEAGACAPMLVYKDMKYQNSTGFSMGLFYELLEAFMLLPLFRKYFYLRYVKNNPQKNPVEVAWVSAACMLIKREVFEKVGGFSEEYFLNYEDIDLCRKLVKAGFKNYYIPSVKCVHLDHGSFKDDFELLITSRYESRLIYGRKYYSYLKRLIHRVVHIPGIILRLIVCPFVYKDTERKQRFRGYFKSLKLYFGIKV